MDQLSKEVEAYPRCSFATVVYTSFENKGRESNRKKSVPDLSGSAKRSYGNLSLEVISWRTFFVMKRNRSDKRRF